LGRRSRRKGKSFELVVRDRILLAFREKCPGLIIRRSSQAERAHEADLIIEGPGCPARLSMLWVECEHAKAPDPRVKWAQACRDSAEYTRKMAVERYPLVCWRKNGERTLWATAALDSLSMILNNRLPYAGGSLLVTLRLDDLLSSMPV
jgi:hypothetical protein